MRKLAFLVAVLQFLVLTAAAAETAPKTCTFCVGAVVQADAMPAGKFPLYVPDVTLIGPSLHEVPPDSVSRMIALAPIHIAEGDPLTQIEAQTTTLVAWAKSHGPFYAFGTSVPTTDPSAAAYAIKRLSVTMQGLGVAKKIVLAPTPLDQIEKLYEAGAGPYFDAVIVNGPDVAAAAAWFADKDPIKQIYAVVPPQSPNPLFDLAQAFANGATLALLQTDSQTIVPLTAAFDNFNQMFAGDYAYDKTAKIDVLDAKGNPEAMPVLTFVRGEDLRTILIPKGDANAPAIVALPSDRYTRPRRVDEKGDAEVTDVGKKGGRFLIGMQPVKAPFALTVDHEEKIDKNVTKEAIEIQTKKGITVEEIIRNHQAYKAYEDSIQPRYIARDTTKLRFTIEAGESIEATIAGDYFSEPQGRKDWVWQDFYVNGVRWKYGKIPELPLIQPEKVTQLPLDLHLTNDYHYTLVRETDLLGHHTYEVRFEPPPNAPAALPLYRGTVWIDTKSWARIRISMIQLNLTGEVLSNEERVDFQPFAREGYRDLTPAEAENSDPRAVLWLPKLISAQQVISVGGRADPVLRETDFTNFRIDPPDFEGALKTASASDARMVRETPATGMQYLEKKATGERVVKEGFDTSRKFLLGGVHHDAGLQYPVLPLGGIDYFNFNLRNTGIQTNVFFAGIVVVANATNPNVANTRTNVGVDFFGIAVPTTSTVYRNGIEQKNEAVRSLGTSLTLRAGHPFAQFAKIDVSLGLSHVRYSRDTDTDPTFTIPTSTFVLSPSVDMQYARWGWVASGFYEYNHRTQWKPWGILSEYNDNQKSFADFGATVGKSFYLPKFQRIGVELNYLDGTHLDRFSKYELGFFGTQRVHGIRSGSVRAEKMTLGHLTYGFVFSDQFRIEAYYDYALVTDRTAGYDREPFQGVGIGGQTVGPWGTLVRLDIGKTIGRNAQNGFVANVVLLKLF
ncbi:MAG TPA: hypothetical protein VH087_12430 [Thermoanaerobaculia bacterium]|nr:hypothetical protein [Thermoanaerobaculia bacterium]